LYSFIQYGKALGFVLADVITLIDGLVVIGGGISAAWDLFAPAMFKAIHKKHRSANGNTCNRTTVKVFNLENEQEKQIFFKGTVEKIKVFANNSIYCDTMARTAVMRSKRKASNSISIGAYYFAISQLNNHKNN
jgi:predicted NBD/HSP70 family sugar kinase